MMLCFVITLEQGRVKPSDRLTMELVFKALNQVLFSLLCKGYAKNVCMCVSFLFQNDAQDQDLENSYGLIINRLEGPVYQKLTEDGEETEFNREKIMNSLCKRDQSTGRYKIPKTETTDWQESFL
jgi:hypothetical protein